jgi:hypothetical protein
MKKLLKEPLLHFLLLGALLFALDAWRDHGAREERAARQVHISESGVRWLKQTWARQWQREPSEPELRGLVTDYLKESLLAREATQMGLEENDTIIRRRLAQKLEFLIQDTARLAEPGDEQLRPFFEARRTEFQTPARVSFTQLYFKSEAAARQGLEQLAMRSADELGERTLLDRDHVRAEEQTVTSQFGREFAGAVFELELGSWHGPVASAYGFHLVRVSAREAAEPRSLEEVRGPVTEEWHRQQQARAKEQFFAALLKKYDVVVDESIRPLVGAFAENSTGGSGGKGGARE